MRLDPSTLAVHPHTRGEHGTRCLPAASACGSSPHAWGTLVHGAAVNAVLRFIPTRVGNTRIRAFGLIMKYGSSPHAWGTLRCPLSSGTRLRFIPTRVGNTSWARSTKTGWSVHPHTRGEHRRIFFDERREHGSSPHAWGTHRGMSPKTAKRRFIPTRVGNTPARTSATRARPVHPHTRGEHRTASRRCR